MPRGVSLTATRMPPSASRSALSPLAAPRVRQNSESPNTMNNQKKLDHAMPVRTYKGRHTVSHAFSYEPLFTPLSPVPRQTPRTNLLPS